MSMKVDQIQKDLQTNQGLQTDIKPSLYQYNMTLLKNFIFNSKITFIAFLVIWVCFIISYILTILTTKSSNFGIANISTDVLIKMGANMPHQVYKGQVYRLITAMFLHGGILHIIMNSGSLIVFCASIEAQVSLKLYLIAYIIGGIQGNMLSNFVHYQWGNINSVSIGASTSICAIMGLYISILYIDSKKNRNTQVNKKQIISMLVFLFFISILPGVDFFGHFGSLIPGFLIGMISFIKFQEADLKKYLILSIIVLLIYSIILWIPFF